MRSVTVAKEHENKKIDKFLKEIFPDMPSGAIYKALRKKDIKANGKRIKEDYHVCFGDRLEIYIIDEILEGKPIETDAKLNRGFEVAYEDSQLLIVNKEQGIPVHPDRHQSSGTLIDQVHDYLKEKGEFSPGSTSHFAPSLCHRLDRNTGGLVIIAKDSDSLNLILKMMKKNEIKKYYQCLVKGKMERPSDELQAYLIKDEKKSRVFIKDYKEKNALEIITKYRVLSYADDISRLEVQLLTGRTHQIRAHMAHIGHPILGDGKYGINSLNRALKAKFQALWAYKIVFDFKDAGKLNYLKGQKFEVVPQFKIKGFYK